MFQISNQTVTMSTDILELPTEEAAKLSTITEVRSEITRMKADYSGLTIKDVYDKTGLTKVSAARKEVKALRVKVDKARVALVDDAVKWQRQVNEVAKEITSEIRQIEDELQKKEDDIEAEKARIKAQAEKELKERSEKRNSILMSMGAVFTGTSYALGEASIQQYEVGGLTDEDFQTKVELFESEYQKALDAKLEAERIAKEEAERLEVQRKQQEAQAAELKRQQDELKAQQAAFEKQKADEQRAIDEENARMAAELKRQQDAIDAQKREAEAKLEAERQAELNAQREVERQAELEKARVEAAEKAKVEAELKAKRDAEAKIEADRIAKEKEARKLARRPDIEKFNDMTSQIDAIINSFQFKTEEGKNAQQDFKTGVQLLIKTSKLSAE